jgi:hypothetical protein
MRLFISIAFLIPTMAFSQNSTFDKALFDSYEQYKEQSLDRLRIKQVDILPLIEHIGMHKGFEVRLLGHSMESRPIQMISVGKGKVDIMLWSQMHGDEPTATMAIFDILNFLTDESSFAKEKKKLLKEVRLHFIPMLNPDGAEVYKRKNALDIDINRDALRLQTSEGRILKQVRDSLNADFGFNLHDQSVYYNVERTEKPATISYLAPAYDYEKSVNEVRGNAMKVIAYMNSIVQNYAPGQVGRYSDDFEPRAFGDNIQKWGTSAILIESGGYTNDPEKQFIRKLNYISILSSIFAISDGSYAKTDLAEYEKIPNNDRKLFDLKIENVTYTEKGVDYLLDLGIYNAPVSNFSPKGYHYQGQIYEIGDLSTYYGYQTVDAKGLNFEVGKVYTIDKLTLDSLRNFDFNSILSSGHTEIYLSEGVKGISYSEYPINISRFGIDLSKDLSIGMNATFVLKDGDEVRYVIVNGFIYDVKTQTSKIPNGIVR